MADAYICFILFLILLEWQEESNNVHCQKGVEWAFRFVFYFFSRLSVSTVAKMVTGTPVMDNNGVQCDPRHPKFYFGWTWLKGSE